MIKAHNKMILFLTFIIIFFSTPTSHASNSSDFSSADQGCAAVEDYYSSETSGLASVVIGPATFQKAYMANGEPVPMSVISLNGVMNLEIPWSEDSASQKARAIFSDATVNSNNTQAIKIRMSHTYYALFQAYDADDNLLTSQGASDEEGTAQTVILNSSDKPIKRIDILGAEIYIESICWYGVQNNTGTPAAESGCINANNQYSSPQEGLSQVEMGFVTATQAKLSNGEAVPLSIGDFLGNGVLALEIPWTESSASTKAKLIIDGASCDSGAPKSVTVHLAHTNYAKLTAYCPCGDIVATVEAESDKSKIQALTVSSVKGIAIIEIEGSEMAIYDVCENCSGIQVDQGDDDTASGEEACSQDALDEAYAKGYEAGLAAAAAANEGTDGNTVCTATVDESFNIYIPCMTYREDRFSLNMYFTGNVFTGELVWSVIQP